MSAAGPSSLGPATPAPARVAGGGARTAAQAAARPDLPAAPAPVRGHRGADAADRSRDHADDMPASSTFSGLLVPTAPVPGPRALADTDSEAPGGPDPAAPEQLLALLDGRWSHAGAAVPPAAQPAPGADPGAGAALVAAATPARVALPPAAHPDGAGEAATASPAPVADGTTGGDIPFASRAATGTGGAGAVQADAPPPGLATPSADPAPRPAAGIESDNSVAIEAPSASMAATPMLAASRPQATPLPPLPMPAQAAAGFDDGFGDRIAWIVEQRLGHAEIRLNPEHLGPIDVRVQLDGDLVRAGFHSAHADVLQAIEATLPRLRELLGQHGLQLGQADVGPRQGGQHGAAGRAPAMPGTGAADADATGQASARSAYTRPRGLVDAYA